MMNPGMQGVVEVICGCMFSGKTEELIRRAKEAHYAQKRSCYLNLCWITVIANMKSFHIMVFPLKRM